MPRRLVYCLPMRVLVEQAEAKVCVALQHLGWLWDGVSTSTSVQPVRDAKAITSLVSQSMVSGIRSTDKNRDQ